MSSTRRYPHADPKMANHSKNNAESSSDPRKPPSTPSIPRRARCDGRKTPTEGRADAASRRTLPKTPREGDGRCCCNARITPCGIWTRTEAKRSGRSSWVDSRRWISMWMRPVVIAVAVPMTEAPAMTTMAMVWVARRRTPEGAHEGLPQRRHRWDRKRIRRRACPPFLVGGRKLRCMILIRMDLETIDRVMTGRKACLTIRRMISIMIFSGGSPLLPLERMEQVSWQLME
mmetsp:Transcript_43045/g.90426  ORF Transcript_43045/g.90426 Transcript_43045/m.90426 type:complete len:231 (-) Transcript_43045:2943-3635(-)